ncbi:hypothetical protein ACIGDI_34480 [Streptomyces sp. NPDC085900]|uniref:hypothetical protein n=1 Tax=Streptomyces sp. NPDC085900 TaxID=3365737 RepID=UPI0037D17AFE
MYENEPDVKKVIDTAKGVEGLILTAWSESGIRRRSSEGGGRLNDEAGARWTGAGLVRADHAPT